MIRELQTISVHALSKVAFCSVDKVISLSNVVRLFAWQTSTTHVNNVHARSKEIEQQILQCGIFLIFDMKWDTYDLSEELLLPKCTLDHDWSRSKE